MPLASVIGDNERHLRNSSSELLIEFTDHLVDGSYKKLPNLRRRIINEIGQIALVEASATVATFSMLDRIANATGIPLEAEMVKMSEDFREDLGINSYYSASNTLQS